MNRKDNLIILGIESSCDETAAALVEKQGSSFKILSNIVSSQIEIHKKYGGVVPEVAARNHIINIIPVVDEALAKAKITPKRIDQIAVTTGPGLITSLLIGVETAKTLAYTWQKPIYSINHLKAHLYANWLNHETWNMPASTRASSIKQSKRGEKHGTKIAFPIVALIVSGGHTELILMKNEKNMKKIGQTLDDAAGEAFDKVAQLLQIGYPGGPIISKLAQAGNPQAFKFARPMITSNDFNFSFSGLKTSVLYTVQKLKKMNQQTIADLCASFQQATVDVLVAKTFKAAKHYQAKTVMLSGGVAANQLLRETLKLSAEGGPTSGGQATSYQLDFLMPTIDLCTDNAAMIAVAACFEKPTPWQKLRVDPNLEI